MAKTKKTNDVVEEILDSEEEVVEKAKKGRVRKVKYITLYSHFLMKETKHELLGEPIVTKVINEEGIEVEVRQQWARCTRSRHTQLVNLSDIDKKGEKPVTIITVTKETARKYKPTEQYTIGEQIYHEKWDDIGVVQKKEVTGNGGSKITVQFKENHEKILMENLKL